MKTFRGDGQPSRDDECEHGFRRFEKCPHCLEAENEQLREALREIMLLSDKRSPHPMSSEADYFRIARAALREKE